MPCLAAPLPALAGAAAPTTEELAGIEAVISKEGCGQAMADALEATSARKAAGQAANNLSYKLHLSVHIWLRSSCRVCARAKS
jgi:hypothetical protein